MYFLSGCKLNFAPRISCLFSLLFNFSGHEEKSARVASISLGMMLLILIPCLLLLVCGANYWIREQIAKEEQEAAAALLPKSKWQKSKQHVI